MRSTREALKELDRLLKSNKTTFPERDKAEALREELGG
jgi:hypothetical protein